MCGNFIKIDRKITKWEWWSDINTFRVFIYMLISAYWKDGNYKGILIPRGSFPSSISDLSKETNLTENEIRTALKHLKSTGEITSKSTNRFTVFTVNNYNLYQSINEQDYKQNTNKSQTINKPLTSTILKEYKEEKNINNTCSRVSRFNDFFSAYPKQKNMIAAEKEYVLLLFNDQSLTELDLIVAAENYADAVCILGTSERFIKMPNRFLAEGTYVDYLDKNYAKPKREENKSREPTKQFNDFLKTDYDFEELEKQILAN